MARSQRHIAQVLKQIERLNDEEQCELLEQMLLKHRRADLGWTALARLRAQRPRRSERQVKRDADAAIREVRRELAQASRP